MAAFFFLRLRRKPSPLDRALWLQKSCSMVLRRLSIERTVIGQPPGAGLIVSNHLSYFDILLYSAVMPCAFVAKTEVRKWPMVGLLASLGGTIYIDRTRAAGAAAAARQIERLLGAGVRVLLFPEGTSSDGSRVLRFHPSLFEPAILTATPIAAAAVGYCAGSADEKELSYYGDNSFGPHLLKTLALPRIEGFVQFSSHAQVDPDRKAAAARTHREVDELRRALKHVSLTAKASC